MSAPVPRPGQHLPSHAATDGPSVDPEEVTSAVDALIAQADDAAGAPFGEGTSDPHGLVTLTRQAQFLDRAHDALVEALASVDKN